MQPREKDIIDEIHERREQIMARFGNDLHRYVAYLRERQRSVLTLSLARLRPRVTMKDLPR